MDIIATSGGINWEWYHWGTLTEGVFTIAREDRFHKFNEWGKHPEYTHTVEFFDLVPYKDDWPESFKARKLAHIAHIREKHGWDESVTRYAILTKRGTIEQSVVIAR